MVVVKIVDGMVIKMLDMVNEMMNLFGIVCNWGDWRIIIKVSKLLIEVIRLFRNMIRVFRISNGVFFDWRLCCSFVKLFIVGKKIVF